MANLKRIDPEKRENIFELENPETYYCRVAGYAISHSYLWVIASNGDHEISLVFGMPQYFEGPVRWSGANFTRQSDEECLKLLETIGVTHLPADILRLYEVKTAHGNVVKILADIYTYTSDRAPGIIRE